MCDFFPFPFRHDAASFSLDVHTLSVLFSEVFVFVI